MLSALCFVFAWMTLCTFCILVYTSAWGNLLNELWFFMCHVHVKGTQQILVAVCVVEFTGLQSNFLVCFKVYPSFLFFSLSSN